MDEGKASVCDAGEEPVPESGAQGVRRRRCVLVIDDEPLILRIVASILGADHDITCESRADLALDRIRRGERYDAILCDLMMPQLTGMDLYDALIEIAPKQARCMLFVTGGAFTARGRAFIDRVPNATIEKPFGAAALLSRVREIVDQEPIEG
jgi:CheY-like chemotaxis protein